MNAKQFAWTYMVLNGHANMKKSFYGGTEAVDPKAPGKKRKPGGYCDSWNDAFIQQIKTVGVNWNKTDAPYSEKEASFTDTFHDPEDVEVLYGDLVLNNGYKQRWMGEPLVMGVFEAMAAIDEFKAKYKEIFGEE